MRYPIRFGFAVLIHSYLTNPVFGIGTAFLTVPSDPRELALGGATTSIIGDPSLSRGNPALIVQNRPVTEIYLGYSSWLAGVKGSSVLIVQPALGGSLGFRVRHLGLSDLELRTSRPTDNYLAHFAASGTTFEGMWGRRFDPLRVGASIRWIRIESYVYSSSGAGLDLGIWWPLVGNRLSIGAAIRNLGRMNAYAADSPGLPTTMSGGVTYELGPKTATKRGEFHASFGAGTEVSEMHGPVTRIAGELSLGEGRFTLATRLSQEVTAVSGGISVNWRHFQIAYGIEIGSQQLGVPHLIRLRLTLP